MRKTSLSAQRPERPAPPTETQLRDPKFRFTVQMVLAARRWRSVLDENLRTIGTSAARMEAMSTIDRAPWLSAQVEIANRMGIEKPTLTRMLDTLEAEHLVERLPDPWDRRAKLIRLTAKGEETLRDASRLAGALRAQLLDGFTEEEIALANRVNERLLTRLEDGLGREEGE